MGRRVLIPGDVREEMVGHALEEYPGEACGLLAGSRSEDGSFRVMADYRTRNSAASPLMYEVDPEDMYRVLMEVERRGMEVIGAYHSHPLGRAVPSRLDEERAHPGFLYVIISVPRVRIRAFLWEGRFVELPITGR